MMREPPITAPSASKPTSHFYALDSFRGLAALLVAVYHLPVLNDAYTAAFMRNAYLVVDFFFVLSGFVISETYANRLQTPAAAGRFVLRRIGRLWPLHISLLLVFLALFVTRLLGVHTLPSTTPAFNVTWDPATLPSQIVLAQAWGFQPWPSWNAPSWSISAELFTYLAFALVILIAPRRWGIVAGLIALAAAITVASLSTHYMNLRYELGLPRCLYGFFVGSLTWRLWRSWSHRGLPYPTLCEIAAIALSWSFIVTYGQSNISFVAPLIFASVVFVFAFQKGEVSNLLQLQPLLLLGKWSYSIYMVHWLLILSILGAVDWAEAQYHVSLWVDVTTQVGTQARVIWFPPASFLDVATLLYLLTVVAVSRMTFRLIEVPGQRWIATAGNWMTSWWRPAPRIDSPQSRRPEEAAQHPPRRFAFASPSNRLTWLKSIGMTPLAAYAFARRKELDREPEHIRESDKSFERYSAET